jgi:hypothetical protein
MLEQAKDMFVDLPHKIIKYIFYDWFFIYFI